MNLFKILAGLWPHQSSKPPEVTVVSSGAIEVDPVKLLQTDAAKEQIKALHSLQLSGTKPSA